ncbi:MAG: glycosyltransferase family 2 protein [Patescibacteria group bacterium]
MISRAPLVSVIILNWNGKKFLHTCVSSLVQIKNPLIEIIVVDNNSSDGSVSYMRKNFPKVKVIASDKNNGFAGGNNIGARTAAGQYLLFLNNDTKVSKEFLLPIIEACKRDPHIGCVQPEMRVMDHPDLLDEAGAYLTMSGFLYHYGYRKVHRLPMYRTTRVVFSAKGACMLIPKHAFEEVGGFDEDFFIFFEETDLCHRLWLAGYKVLYQPDSYIYHVAGGDTTDTYNYERRVYLTFKNMNCSYLKNFGTLYLATIYPVFAVFQIGVLFYFLMSLRLGVVAAILKGWWWNLVNLQTTLKKRNNIQQNIRKVTDRGIRRSIYYNPGLYYYFCLLLDAKRYRHVILSQYEITV